MEKKKRIKFNRISLRYREWIKSSPFDCGNDIKTALTPLIKNKPAAIAVAAANEQN